MIRDTRFLNIFLLICLGVFALNACSIDEHDLKLNNKSFSIQQAKENFENEAKDLRFISFFNQQKITKSFEENIVPDWNNAIYQPSADGEVVMIPLNLSDNIKGKLNVSYGHYTTFFHKDHEVKSYLVVEKMNNGSIRRFVTTSIGSIDDKHKNDKPHLYTGNRKHFRGLFMISDEEGKCQKVRLYVGGKAINLFYEEEHHNHSHANNTTDSKEHTKNSFKSFSIGFTLSSNSKTLTKGGGNSYDTGEGEFYCYFCNNLVDYIPLQLTPTLVINVCSNCGYPPEEIGGGTLYYYCQGCGKLEELCDCNGNDPDPYGNLDDRCPKCGMIGCNGACQGSNGGGGGNGGLSFNREALAYSRKSTDKLVSDNQSLFLNLKSINNVWCSVYSMCYILNSFNVKADENTIKEYFQSYLEDLKIYTTEQIHAEILLFLAAGLPNEMILTFTQYIFNTNLDIDNINSGIDQGYFVLTSIVGDPLHMIVIVGYRGDEQYIYYDPSYGDLRINYKDDLHIKSWIPINSKRSDK